MTRYSPAQVAKAIAAFATAATGAMITAAAEDGISGTELIIVVLTAAGACAAVFATPNAPVTSADEPGQ